MLEEWIGWFTPTRVENIAIALGSGLFGTLGGALGGAWAAEKIASSKIRLNQLEQEIRDTNAAIGLSYAVCNRALNLKEQHVQKLAANYLEQLTQVHAHYQGVRSGKIHPDTELVLGFVDHQLIEKLRTPIERLEETVLAKINAQGKIPQLIIALEGATESLNELIISRNSLVERFQKNEIPEKEKSPRMFAVALPDGSVDAMYRDLTIGLVRLTDDCIYFSRRLCGELDANGELLRKQFTKRQLRRAPKIMKCFFSTVDERGLMPAADQYRDWEAAFYKRVPGTEGRWSWKCFYWKRLQYRRLKHWLSERVI